MELYDLELEKRTALSAVFAGFNPVFTPALNTVSKDEILNIIEYYGDEPDGVKVLSEIPGGEEFTRPRSKATLAANDYP